MIPEITSHLQSGTGISVVYCRFLDCFSENGGAIFSESENDHKVKYCEFISCKATTRGGAILLQKGNCEITQCCGENCQSYYCGDFVLWIPSISKVSLIQSYKAVSDVHSFI